MAVNALLFLQWIIVSVLVITTKGHDDFSIEEATIDSIQRAFAEDKLTSLQLVDLYLQRIQNLNPVLRSVLEINPHARVQAEEADRQRKSNSHHPRSFMHGVPVLLKDTIATDDKMNTTAGSYALLGSVVGRDARVVEKLRNVGAVILGKASLTEWYSFRALGKIPNGWCARGGQAQVLQCLPSLLTFNHLTSPMNLWPCRTLMLQGLIPVDQAADQPYPWPPTW